MERRIVVSLLSLHLRHTMPQFCPAVFGSLFDPDTIVFGFIRPSSKRCDTIIIVTISLFSIRFDTLRYNNTAVLGFHLVDSVLCDSTVVDIIGTILCGLSRFYDVVVFGSRRQPKCVFFLLYIESLWFYERILCDTVRLHVFVFNGLCSVVSGWHGLRSGRGAAPVGSGGAEVLGYRGKDSTSEGRCDMLTRKI